MTETLAGWTVTNAIPADVVTGLMAGQYRQYGGVIRWAPDTEQAGQIVRHLVPVSEDLIPAMRIAHPMLATAQGTMTLAGGLSLSVGVIGFAFIFGKLLSLSKQLGNVAKDVKAVKSLLELEEKAKLEAALESLVDALEFSKPGNKTATLLWAKATLSPLRVKYKELLSEADTLETALGYEQYFFFASLAHATCLAELGELRVAKGRLEEDCAFYESQARRIAKQLILGDDPQRFLFGSYVEALPGRRLAACLDFVEEANRGEQWIDELRKELRPSSTMEVFFGGPDAKVKADSELGIPALLRFVARDELLQGYVAQYELLEPGGLAPSEFGKQAARIGSKLGVDHVILAPPPTLKPPDATPASG